jgi:hypothetical protein
LARQVLRSAATTACAVSEPCLLNCGEFCRFRSDRGAAVTRANCREDRFCVVPIGCKNPLRCNRAVFHMPGQKSFDCVDAQAQEAIVGRVLLRALERLQ